MLGTQLSGVTIQAACASVYLLALSESQVQSLLPTESWQISPKALVSSELRVGPQCCPTLFLILTWGGSVLAVTSLCSPRPLSPKCSSQKRNLGCVGRREAQGTGKVQSRVLLAPAGGQVKTRREHADGILLSWGQISAMLGRHRLSSTLLSTKPSLGTAQRF